MTTVGRINTSQEVSTISKKHGGEMMYGTIYGKIGKVRLIDEEKFIRLRKI